MIRALKGKNDGTNFHMQLDPQVVFFLEPAKGLMGACHKCFSALCMRHVGI